MGLNHVLRLGLLSTARINGAILRGAAQHRRGRRRRGRQPRRPPRARRTPPSTASAARTATTARCWPTPTSTRSTSRCPTRCTCRGPCGRWRPASTCCARSRCRPTPTRSRTRSRSPPRTGSSCRRRSCGATTRSRSGWSELVAGGAIGELRLVRASFSFPLTTESDVRWEPALEGGSLMDVGCYCVSAMRLLAGEPERVHAEAVLAPSGVDVRFAGALRFAGDVLGHIRLRLRPAGARRARGARLRRLAARRRPVVRPRTGDRASQRRRDAADDRCRGRRPLRARARGPRGRHRASAARRCWAATTPSARRGRSPRWPAAPPPAPRCGSRRERAAGGRDRGLRAGGRGLPRAAGRRRAGPAGRRHRDARPRAPGARPRRASGRRDRRRRRRACDDIDLLVVATPNRAHVPLALEALERGIAVVVDKPLAAQRRRRPSADRARRAADRVPEPTLRRRLPDRPPARRRRRAGRDPALRVAL